MPAAVMRDDAIAVLKEEQHLRIPVVAAQWPAVMEHDGLGRLRSPVLVEDFRAVRCLDKPATHFMVSFGCWIGPLGSGKASGGEQSRRRETGSSGENATSIKSERHARYGQRPGWPKMYVAGRVRIESRRESSSGTAALSNT